MNPYIGCESQLYGIEEHRLIGGKGDGMRLLQIRNGHGMELTVSLDRCCDISRLSCDGVNMGYFSPCGYVEPSYYQPTGTDSIYQPKLKKGLTISFDASKLDGFVEWKMMGVRDYMLGLECGNCYPDGRDVMRKTGMLKFLKPGKRKMYEVKIDLR